MKLYTTPTITLLGYPTFVEPAHLPVQWKGAASDGERLAEYGGRVCYMAHHNPSDRDTREYLRNILRQRHGSVLEHANYSVLLEGVSRSLTHELLRHRAGTAFSQLSQRYVDEAHINFVVPPALLALDDAAELVRFEAECQAAVESYARRVEKLLARYLPTGLSRRDARIKAREAARAGLPNCTETKVVMTANVRAWRHILELRGSADAEAEIRRWAAAMAMLLTATAPDFFQDVRVVDGVVQVEHSKV